MSTLIFSTRWRTVLGGIAILGLSSGATWAAESFFRDCDSALEAHGFERLKMFYTKNKDNPRPSTCFKLNRDEFLVTVEDTGRIGQGLYYYDAAANSYGLVDGQYRSNIQIKQEFLGPANKRYVLIKSSNLHRGDWNYGYEVLYLTSGKKRQSFVVKELLFAQEDPESGLCGSRLSTVATSISDVHVSGEGGPAVRVEFAVEEEDCTTHKRQKYVKTFQPRDRGFAEVVVGSP